MGEILVILKVLAWSALILEILIPIVAFIYVKTYWMRW